MRKRTYWGWGTIRSQSGIVTSAHSAFPSMWIGTRNFRIARDPLAIGSGGAADGLAVESVPLLVRRRNICKCRASEADPEHREVSCGNVEVRRAAQTSDTAETGYIVEGHRHFPVGGQ